MSEDDSASICSQLEEAVKCAICWDPPVLPKVLPCQHSFCLRCLHPSYLSDVQARRCSRDRVQCPLCRREHPLPKQGGVTALPTDHRTNVITEIVGRRRHIKDKKLCNLCAILHSYKTASYCCLTCGNLLCYRCSQEHQTRGLHNNHIQIGLSDGSSFDPMCTDHPHENIQYYCGECERTVCKICAHGLHQTHEVVDFVTIQNGGESTIVMAEKMRVFMEDKRNHTTEYKDRLKQIGLTMADDKQRLEEELQQVHDDICDLENRQKELERRLEMHTVIDTYIAELDETMDRSLERLDQLEDVIKSSEHPLEQYENITVRELSFQGLQRAFTKVQLPYLDLDMIQKQYSDMVDGYDKDDDVDGVHYFVDIDLDVINSKIKVLWTKDLSVYDVQFLPDGSRSMVCTGQSLKWKLHLVDFGGSPSDLPPTLSKFSGCDCRLMASMVTSAMCVTHRTKADGLCLPFSVIYPDGTTKTGSIETSPDQVSLCGLTVTRYHDVVFAFMDYVFPPDRTSLRCHRPGGGSRWHKDTSIRNGSAGLVTPHYITVDPLNRIIISDHYGSKVSIYDSNGRHLLAFPKVILPDDAEDDIEQYTPRPSGICVDSKGNIYVAFPTYDVISLFTANGKFVRHVVATQGKARGISICEDRYLAVGTFDCGLWLYDLSPSGSDDDEMENDTLASQTNLERETSTDGIRARQASDECVLHATNTDIDVRVKQELDEEGNELNAGASIQPTTTSDAGNDSDVQTDTADDIKAHTDAEMQTHTDTNIQTNTDADIQIHTDADIQIHTDTDIQTHTDADIQTHTDTDIQTHTDADIQTHTDTDIQTHTDADIQTHTDTYIQTHTDADIQTHTDADIQTHTDADIHTHTDADIQTHTDADIQTHTDTDIQTHTDADIQTHTDADIQTHTDADIQTHTDADIQTHTDADIQTHTDADIQTHTDDEARSLTDSDPCGDLGIRAVNDSDQHKHNDGSTKYTYVDAATQTYTDASTSMIKYAYMFLNKDERTSEYTGANTHETCSVNTEASRYANEHPDGVMSNSQDYLQANTEGYGHTYTQGYGDKHTKGRNEQLHGDALMDVQQNEQASEQETVETLLQSNTKTIPYGHENGQTPIESEEIKTENNSSAIAQEDVISETQSVVKCRAQTNKETCLGVRRNTNMKVNVEVKTDGGTCSGGDTNTKNNTDLHINSKRQTYPGDSSQRKSMSGEDEETAGNPGNTLHPDGATASYNLTGTMCSSTANCGPDEGEIVTHRSNSRKTKTTNLNRTTLVVCCPNNLDSIQL